MAAATDLPWIDPAEPLAATGRAVITTDPPGAVPSGNRAAQHRSGWTAAEAIGRDIAELTVPEVGQDVAADIMAAVRDGISWWITPEAAFELLVEVCPGASGDDPGRVPPRPGRRPADVTAARSGGAVPGGSLTRPARHRC